MLKDKEVVADAQRQYEIARTMHAQGHGGINKTTATIAERYHWVRIKETVSLVIRNCSECKEGGKTPAPRAEGPGARLGQRVEADPNSRIERLVSYEDVGGSGSGSRRKGRGNGREEGRVDGALQAAVQGQKIDLQGQGGAPVAPMRGYENLQIDPQIMVVGQGMDGFAGEGGERDGVGEEDYEMEVDGRGGDREGMHVGQAHRAGLRHHLMEEAFGAEGEQA